MILKIGNIFDDISDLDYVGITTNSKLNKSGELIMGAGNAKAAKHINPQLPRIFGDKISNGCGDCGFYGVFSHKKFFAFQTKLDWRDKSPLDVVTRSTEMLIEIANKMPTKTFGLPYPAINHGGLAKDDVYPIIKRLPNNVIVYEL